jgi:NAD(P)H-hydrate epimerase
MSCRPLTRSEVREVDRIAVEEFEMNSLVLMENAGREAAGQITQLQRTGDVCILCGKGNNAGDGYVIARHLQAAHLTECNEPDGDEARLSVRIVSLSDTAELRGDAAANHTIACRAGIPINVVVDRDGVRDAIGAPAIIVDCLLGTGASGNPREPFAEAIRIANALSAKRVAIDLPSGLDCDSGELGEPTFRADLTLTFVAAKVGFSTATAQSVLGDIVVLPIGVPLRLLSRYQ